MCVDVTPLKKVNTQYGEREVFRLVFEIDQAREDGSRWCVWSQGFTPSLHEKAGFRKFLRGWFGRDLSEAERELFETDSLIGKPGFLVITHATKDDQIYANVASCTPHKTGQPLKPCGKYIRVQDRDRQPEAPAPSAAKAMNSAAFHATGVHVGRHRGCRLGELAEDSVEKLVEHWLPTAKTNPKPSEDDRRLIAALDWYVEQRAVTAAATAADDIPF